MGISKNIALHKSGVCETCVKLMGSRHRLCCERYLAKTKLFTGGNSNRSNCKWISHKGLQMFPNSKSLHSQHHSSVSVCCGNGAAFSWRNWQYANGVCFHRISNVVCAFVVCCCCVFWRFSSQLAFAETLNSSSECIVWRTVVLWCSRQWTLSRGSQTKIESHT